MLKLEASSTETLRMDFSMTENGFLTTKNHIRQISVYPKTRLEGIFKFRSTPDSYSEDRDNLIVIGAGTKTMKCSLASNQKCKKQLSAG